MSDALPTLDRRPPFWAASRPVPPIRILHFGLGAFHRAHEAWYTAHAADAEQWGIAALTGRSPDAARTLGRQGGLYTLVERGAERDRAELVGSIVEAVDGDDVARLVALFGEPRLAVVSLTVTEAGYRLDDRGLPDPDDAELGGELAALATALAPDVGTPSAVAVGTVLGRLLLGLDARRRSGGGPLAVVPCDNVPDNGERLRRGLDAAASEVSAALRAWIAQNVSFVSTSVDRITPKTQPEDIEALAVTTGRLDLAPVITEPFSDWVLSGRFPAGRPDWESAGARFVDDLRPWEQRKLWLLNGAHTYLAFAGPLRGHSTVAEAIADEALRAGVDGFWDEACRHLEPELELESYRAALLQRFANPRIEHRLAQIATDGTEKLRLRVVPVAERELAAGRAAPACARVIAAWLAADPDRPAAGGGRRSSIADAVASLSPRLAASPPFLAAVQAAADPAHP